MGKFPKRYCLPDGSIYAVTLENVRDDWAFTVRQFDDISNEQAQEQIDSFDEEQAEQWMSDQWYGAEIVTWGTDTGEVDEEARASGLLSLKRSRDQEWASDLQVMP